MKQRREPEEIEIRLFLEAIHARYGYDLREYTYASIERRVLAILAKSGLAHMGELQHRVLTDPNFFLWVLDEVTVTVSDMFRDPSFYRTFCSQVLPVLRTYPLLRFWHAGCATGEEVYASAIMLSEAGLYDRAQLYATDLSARALEQAKQGIYPEHRCAGFEANYREAGGTSNFLNYCTTAYDGVAMKEALRRQMVFFQHDLVSDHVFGEMQVIFCRNVFIYFDRTLREKVLAKFAQSLCAGGFLCLGSAERLSATETKVFHEFDAQEHIYRYRP